MEKIGRYEIKGEIGRGGMATVFEAYDPHFRREVAIKMLPNGLSNDPQFRSRFEREAQTVATLEHPAIVPVYDYGEEDGRLFLVMRLMSGGSLADRLGRGPLTPQAASEIMNELAPALDAANARGIIHRDLKPANILFDQWDKPYLSDFGIVKVASESGTALTAAGGLLGTPAYMSPEQIRGEANLDGRSDIYAMGIILFEMLTGQAPFSATTPMGLVFMQVNEPTPRLVSFNAAVPAACQLYSGRVNIVAQHIFTMDVGNSL
jgi:serine/threonine-protein kinase